MAKWSCLSEQAACADKWIMARFPVVHLSATFSVNLASEYGCCDCFRELHRTTSQNGVRYRRVPA